MLVLGMMSGTSADGIDAALVKISGAPPHLNIKLLGHVKQNFPPSVRNEILRVAEQKPLAPSEFSQLHARLGKLYTDTALSITWPSVVQGTSSSIYICLKNAGSGIDTLNFAPGTLPTGVTFTSPQREDRLYSANWRLFDHCRALGHHNHR